MEPMLAPWWTLTVAALALGGDPVLPKGTEGTAPPARGTAGAPGRELAGRELERWVAGRAFFGREMTQREGLGPAFNAASCGACHVDPAPGGAGGLEFNVRVAKDAGAAPAEGEEAVRSAISRYLETRAVLDARTLEEWRGELERLAAKEDPHLRARLIAGTVQTPSILGLGQLERVHEDEILGREDPDDRDGDGVRGIAQRVTVGGTVQIGRFGWHADLPTLNDFVRAACGGELGLTVPAEVGFGMTADGDLALDPEMTWQQLDELVFFCRELAPPARGGRGAEPEVKRGEEVFEKLGCGVCHVPVLYGADGPVNAYTDLLLHAVVPEVPPSETGSREPVLRRTAPLWGVGATGPYLHDGRAETLADAILAHGGEGLEAGRRFGAVRAGDREALLAFLADL